MARRFWITGLALAGAIGVGGLWARQRACRYEPLCHLVRLNLLGFTAFGGKPAPTAQIVLFGDSRAAAWPAPAGFAIANRGLPGLTSTQARFRYRWDVSPLKPTLVIVQVGVNDLTALGFGHAEERIMQTTVTNLGAIVNEARNDGSRVILATIFGLSPNDYERRDPETAQIQAAIEQVNRTIRAMAAPDVLIFDSAAMLADESGYVAERYQDDLLHINAAGYRILNEALGNLLAEQLRR